MAVDSGFKINLIVALPFVGMILSGILYGLVEKVRSLVFKLKRTLYGTGVMSMITGVVVTAVSFFTQHAIRLNEATLNELGIGQYYLWRIRGMSLSSHVHILSTFLFVSAWVFVTLLFLSKQDEKESRFAKLLSIIKKIFGRSFLLSFLVASFLVIKLIVEGHSGVSTFEIIGCVATAFYLAGFLLVMLFTGHFRMIHFAVGVQNILELNANLFHVSYDYNGILQKTDTGTVIWFGIALILIMLIIFVSVYECLSEENEGQIVLGGWKKSLKEMAFISLGAGAAISLYSRMSLLSIRGSGRVYSDYLMSLWQLPSNKLAFEVSSGAGSIIFMWLQVSVTVFVGCFIIYLLMMYIPNFVEHVMEYLNVGLLWSIVAVFCVILIVTVDSSSIDEGTVENIKQSIGFVVNCIGFTLSFLF